MRELAMISAAAGMVMILVILIINYNDRRNN
jgi:hypothetical protein